MPGKEALRGRAEPAQWEREQLPLRGKQRLLRQRSAPGSPGLSILRQPPRPCVSVYLERMSLCFTLSWLINRLSHQTIRSWGQESWPGSRTERGVAGRVRVPADTAPLRAGHALQLPEVPSVSRLQLAAHLGLASALTRVTRPFWAWPSPPTAAGGLGLA